MNSKLILAAAFIAALTIAGTASAAVELNFAGLNGDAEESPNTYYAGGTGSLGSGPGPNYGITFSDNSLSCSGQPNGTCNTAEIPGGAGANVLFYLSGGASTLNDVNGFNEELSFYYSAVNQPGSVGVYSGLNATGTLLATIPLPLTPNSGNSGCLGSNFCPFVEVSTTFVGTAKSIGFGGSENQVAFADITLGTPVVSAAPEPSTWLLMFAGLATLGAALRLRRRQIRPLTFA